MGCAWTRKAGRRAKWQDWSAAAGGVLAGREGRKRKRRIADGRRGSGSRRRRRGKGGGGLEELPALDESGQLLQA